MVINKGHGFGQVYCNPNSMAGNYSIKCIYEITSFKKGVKYTYRVMTCMCVDSDSIRLGSYPLLGLD